MTKCASHREFHKNCPACLRVNHLMERAYQTRSMEKGAESEDYAKGVHSGVYGNMNPRLHKTKGRNTPLWENGADYDKIELRKRQAIPMPRPTMENGVRVPLLICKTKKLEGYGNTGAYVKDKSLGRSVKARYGHITKKKAPRKDDNLRNNWVEDSGKRVYTESQKLSSYGKKTPSEIK